MNETFIVVAGNIIDGLTFYGPFDSVKSAIEYGQTLSDVWSVTSLTKPG